MKKYFYGLLYKYLSVFVRGDDIVVEVDPRNCELAGKFSRAYVVCRSAVNQCQCEGVTRLKTIGDIKALSPDYILLNGVVHYERDIQRLFSDIRGQCPETARLVVTYFSSLWGPLLLLASKLGVRSSVPETNWISHEDMATFLLLADFEVVSVNMRVLVPVWIPIVSYALNRFVAPLPVFRCFCLMNVLVARPIPEEKKKRPSVSVVVAARNEAGNIEPLIRRLPIMGDDDEVIFVEGHSRDNTWVAIEEVRRKYGEQRRIILARQDGEGKGDAVRKGFSLATRDVLMILDADMTVPPEDLVRFYDALVSGKGEFINGSRLVYPMEERAMRFWNILGNKFFAVAFSFVLSQRFKDTLCGTKVLTRQSYEKIAAHRGFFGEFDPFGDFDLIFGAVRQNLKIVELPVRYGDRTYGTTNISRWRHGILLLGMLFHAARRLKFV